MSTITDVRRRALAGLALAIATLATALTIGAAPAQSATSAAQAQPDDVYCDVVLPVLRKLGYAGEDPLCTS